MYNVLSVVYNTTTKQLTIHVDGKLLSLPEPVEDVPNHGQLTLSYDDVDGGELLPLLEPVEAVPNHGQWTMSDGDVDGGVLPQPQATEHVSPSISESDIDGETCSCWEKRYPKWGGR